jgi:hypothetical protein
MSELLVDRLSIHLAIVKILHRHGPSESERDEDDDELLDPPE